MYSVRKTARELNLRRNPRVALHFDSASGGDVVIFTGDAEIDEGASAPKDHAAYAEKYREGFTRIGTTPEQFSMRYSLPIRVRPQTVRGF
jgi:PPOX class probable F420-dependent enzyme